MIRKNVKPGATCFFAVTGSGDFPFDMLRYDSCWPACESESAKIAIGSYAEPLGMRTVALACKPGDNWRSVPNVKRWHSFGWKASDLYEERYQVPTHAEAIT